MSIHKSITGNRVTTAIANSMFGLDNPGFCLACGADHNACEPDAEGYECYECGEHKVAGAEQVLLMVAF
jgi:anaerobic ribonucleoside-triphosphate reductase